MTGEATPPGATPDKAVVRVRTRSSLADAAVETPTNPSTRDLLAKIARERRDPNNQTDLYLELPPAIQDKLDRPGYDLAQAAVDARVGKGVPRENRDAIVAEFKATLGVLGVDINDEEAPIGQLVERFISSPSPSRPATSENITPKTSFEFVGEVAPEEAVKVLRDQHPQAIALVLSQLPLEKASAILTGLDPDDRNDVIQRMATAEPVNNGRAVEAVATALRKKIEELPQHAPQGRDSGREQNIDHTARIIASAGENTQQLIGSLRLQNPDLAEAIDRKVQEIQRDTTPPAPETPAQTTTARRRLPKGMTQEEADAWGIQSEEVGPSLVDRLRQRFGKKQAAGQTQPATTSEPDTSRQGTRNMTDAEVEALSRQTAKQYAPRIAELEARARAQVPQQPAPPTRRGPSLLTPAQEASMIRNLPPDDDVEPPPAQQTRLKLLTPEQIEAMSRHPDTMSFDFPAESTAATEAPISPDEEIQRYETIVRRGTPENIATVLPNLEDFATRYPDNENGFTTLGQAYASLGHHKRALDAYERRSQIIWAKRLSNLPQPARQPSAADSGSSPILDLGWGDFSERSSAEPPSAPTFRQLPPPIPAALDDDTPAFLRQERNPSLPTAEPSAATPERRMMSPEETIADYGVRIRQGSPDDIRNLLPDLVSFTEQHPDNLLGFQNLDEAYTKIGDHEQADKAYIRASEIYWQLRNAPKPPNSSQTAAEEPQGDRVQTFDATLPRPDDLHNENLPAASPVNLPAADALAVPAEAVPDSATATSSSPEAKLNPDQMAGTYAALVSSGSPDNIRSLLPNLVSFTQQYPDNLFGARALYTAYEKTGDMENAKKAYQRVQQLIEQILPKRAQPAPKIPNTPSQPEAPVVSTRPVSELVAALNAAAAQPAAPETTAPPEKTAEQLLAEQVQVMAELTQATPEEARTLLPDLIRFSESYPDNYQGLVNLGLAYQRLGDREGAFAAYQKAEQLRNPQPTQERVTPTATETPPPVPLQPNENAFNEITGLGIPVTRDTNLDDLMAQLTPRGWLNDEKTRLHAQGAIDQAKSQEPSA